MRVILVTPLAFWLLSTVQSACAMPPSLPVHKHHHHEEKLVVESLPPGYIPHPPREAYNGPLPALLTRPAETFAFPIPIGGIGPSQALFAGENLYPFACDTDKSGLGSPEVDNQEGIGTPVYRGENKDRIRIGYSRDCAVKTRAQYWYLKRGAKIDSGDWALWRGGETDVEMLTLGTATVPFIVRIEMGTINRFVYAIAALRDEHETIDKPASGNWNHKLVYQFQGGVGIGHRQGFFTAAKMLKERGAQLALGYAVLASTGNSTSNQYDIWLQEDTALRVKRQFVAQYGEPLYTVGIGGSGGALQQYLLAQNRPGLLDAGIAQYAYPDMVTQTIPVFDCELLEYYFDVTAHDDPLWHRAEHRIRVEGYSANNKMRDELTPVRRLASLVHARWPQMPIGQTECARSWRGLTPLVLNPNFVPWADRFAPAIVKQVYWSHFEELRHIYGSDDSGYARVPWDNVGVQYGLQALKEGTITVEQFLDLNARIGSWKAPADMHRERFWDLVGNSDGRLWHFSIWSEQNMQHGDREHPASRFHGDPQAINAAYRSGLVFLGRLNIPVIDVRHYLDPVLDMHHSSASFSTRLRLQRTQKDFGMQTIWVTHKPDDPTPLAFAAIDQWLNQIRSHPELSVSANKPESAVDRCFDNKGQLLFAGNEVWNGSWNNKSAGDCMKQYPILSNPRAVAGDDLSGDHFQCVLQDIHSAMAKGLYGAVDMTGKVAELERIFPEGVCDYSQPDRGRPVDL